MHAWRLTSGLPPACCGKVLELLSSAAAAVKVCWKRDEADAGEPLVAPLAGAARLPPGTLNSPLLAGCRVSPSEGHSLQRDGPAVSK